MQYESLTPFLTQSAPKKIAGGTKAKSDLADIGISTPQSAPKKIAGGRFGDVTLENLEACVAGKYGTADPDGVLLHLSE
jgi:hypothetical protein